MPRPVVITRPLAQAGLLAEKIAVLGRETVIFPLLEITPLPDQGELRTTLATLDRFALVAFVGPNAIDAAFLHLRKWPQGVAIAVMGEGSLLALARQGVTDANTTIFRPRDAEHADSESLLKALDLSSLRGKKVLIIRGDTGRELLAEALRAAGVTVVQLTAYRRSVPALDEAARSRLHRLLETENDWIVTSSEALRNLVQLVRGIAGESAVSKLQQQRLIVSHSRIKESAQALGFMNVFRAGSGDEHLLAAIQSAL